MYRINNELSTAFQKRYRRAIKPKSCYENVFKMVVGGYHEANMSDWEILFCYLATKNAEPAVIRHVFLLVDGEIVEPLENIREGAILSSIIPISRLTVDSYMTLLLEGKTYDCQKLLLEKELQALRDSHAIINPFEMSDFVFHFAKDNATCLTLLQAASLGDYEPFYQHLLKIISPTAKAGESLYKRGRESFYGGICV